jgi:hypothetical protein
MAWDLTGNAGTDPATNFLGTTDNQPLVIRTNAAVASREALRIDTGGNVGIGTPTPGSKLDVVGGNVAVTATGGMVGLHAVSGGATSATPLQQAAVLAEGGPNDGVFGSSTGLFGVSGSSTGIAGVKGSSDNTLGTGVQGEHANGTAMRALSLDPLSHTSIAIGRDDEEGRIGVAAAAGQYANDAVAGDIILRTETPSQHLLFGNGPGNSTLAIVNGKVGIGTTNPGSLAFLEIQATGNGVPTGIFANGVRGPNSVAGPIGVVGNSDDGIGIVGNSVSGTGVRGFSTNGIGVFAQSITGLAMQVVGARTAPSSARIVGTALFVEGENGIVAQSTVGGDGVLGFSNSAVGVGGSSVSGTGVLGFSSGGGHAGLFFGPVEVTGRLQKDGGGFLIDHPLDPAHKSLLHSFVESPDMKNIYDGVVVLDTRGEAEVTLPSWFDALNTDFRYQLTAIGASGPDLYIAEEISANRFKIAGGKPHMKVSWQVTGIRQDAWAKANQLPVEQDKPAQEQGHYRHPELYGESEEKSIVRVRYPELKQ